MVHKSTKRGVYSKCFFQMLLASDDKLYGVAQGMAVPEQALAWLWQQGAPLTMRPSVPIKQLWVPLIKLST